jgi:hypothetical protein
MENSMEASKEIENRTTLSYSRASSGYIPKWNEISTISEGYVYSHIHCNIIYKSQNMETT